MEGSNVPAWHWGKAPAATRLVAALFMLGAALGYGAGLVQLHFAHASPGQWLPDLDDTVRIYHGETGPPLSRLERLLAAESGPFNGTGTMKPAFFEKSSGWKRLVDKLPPDKLRILHEEREGERQALLAWVRAGGADSEYEEDRYVLPTELAARPITAEFLVTDDQGQPVSPRAVRIRSLLEARCVRCHQEGGADRQAARFPLDSYERLEKYLQPEKGLGMSLEQLALTTHVHWLGFVMLFSLTGLVMSLTRYPNWLRLVVAPWPLVAQMGEIGLWWLSRLPEPTGVWCARSIAVVGGLVGIGLLVQVVLSLFDLVVGGQRSLEKIE